MLKKKKKSHFGMNGLQKSPKQPHYGSLQRVLFLTEYRLYSIISLRFPIFIFLIYHQIPDEKTSQVITACPWLERKVSATLSPTQPCTLHLQPSHIPNQSSLCMDSHGESNETEKGRKPSELNTEQSGPKIMKFLIFN